MRELREVCEELATLRLDSKRDVLGDVLPAIHTELATDNVIVYSLAETIQGWRMVGWAQHGNADGLRLGLAEAIATEQPMSYSPAAVSPLQRNRVADPIALVGGPARWQATTTCIRYLAPAGMGACRQLRVLLCDGSGALAWFGTVHDGVLSRRHAKILAAVAPAMRKRLASERLLAGASLERDLVDAVIARIGAPAFVIGAGGRLLAVNLAGRALYDRSAAEVRAALAGEPSTFAFDRTQLAATGTRATSLLVLRENTDRRLDDAVALAATRWMLTRRQREVLGYIVQGYSNLRIAEVLQVSVRAVELHVTHLLDRAEVDGRAALTAATLAPRRSA